MSICKRNTQPGRCRFAVGVAVCDSITRNFLSFSLLNMILLLELQHIMYAAIFFEAHGSKVSNHPICPAGGICAGGPRPRCEQSSAPGVVAALSLGLRKLCRPGVQYADIILSPNQRRTPIVRPLFPMMRYLNIRPVSFLSE